jgi:hypothetical protein
MTTVARRVDDGAWKIAVARKEQLREVRVVFTFVPLRNMCCDYAVY